MVCYGKEKDTFDTLVPLSIDEMRGFFSCESVNRAEKEEKQKTINEDITHKSAGSDERFTVNSDPIIFKQTVVKKEPVIITPNNSVNNTYDRDYQQIYEQFGKKYWFDQYRQCLEQLSSDIKEKEKERLVSRDVYYYTPTKWETVKFGNYPQSWPYKKSPVEWLVLKKQTNYAFVLSKYVLDCKQFDHHNNIPWKDSSLRRWLNEVFINECFSAKEQSQILTTLKDDIVTYSHGTSADKSALDLLSKKEKMKAIYSIDNADNSIFGGHFSSSVNGMRIISDSLDLPHLESTWDKIFLLSVEECKAFFRFADSEIKYTPYSVKQGIIKTPFGVHSGKKDEGGINWTRSIYCDYLEETGKNKLKMFAVNGCNYEGRETSNSHIGIRPAMWINYPIK